MTIPTKSIKEINDITDQGTVINIDILDPNGGNYTLATALTKLSDPNSESYRYRKAGMFITFTALEGEKTIQRTYQHIGYKEPNVFNEEYNWIDVTSSGLDTLLDENEFLLFPGGLVNASSGTASDADYIGLAGYTTSILKLKENVDEIIINNNSIKWYAFYSGYPFTNNNFIGSRSSAQPILPKNYKGARYFLCTFQDAQNPDGYSNLIQYQSGIDKVERMLHDDSKNELQAPNEITEGFFIDSNGGQVVNASMAFDKYIIDSNIDRYFLKSVFSSSGFSSFNVIVYYNSVDNIIGQEAFVDSGKVTRTDFILRPPKDAAYFLLNRQISGVGEIYEYSDAYIDVNKISNEIIKIVSPEVLHGKKMKVWFTSDYLHIRTSFDQTQDLIIRINRNDGENNINPNYTWIGLKTQTDAEILAGDYIHDFTDSTGPVWMPEYWYLFAQHGYLIPRIDCTHDKDESDIGSTWQDNTGREYKLGKIDGSRLYFLPPITIGSTIGKDIREWKVPSDNNVITGFTHVSGATHTSEISVIASKSTAQLDPIQLNENRKFLADGKLISDYESEYFCNELTASETLICVNPAKVTKWFPKIEYPENDFEMCRITQSFKFTGLSCAVNTIMDVKYPINFTHYGANQTKTLVPEGGYDSFAIIPKVLPQTFGGVSNVDFRKPFQTSNWQTNGSINFYRDDAYLEDVNNLPDRLISWLENKGTGEYGIGLATGLSLTKGITKNNERLNYVPEGTSYTNQALYYSPSNKNKFYVRAIEGNEAIFPNNLLPASFMKEINYYWAYFNPALQDAKVYDYKDGKDYIVYIHHDKAESSFAVKIPDYLEGLEATIIEKTSGAELITTTVQNGLIYVSLTDDPNYIVLKF